MYSSFTYTFSHFDIAFLMMPFSITSFKLLLGILGCVMQTYTFILHS